MEAGRLFRYARTRLRISRPCAQTEKISGTERGVMDCWYLIYRSRSREKSISYGVRIIGARWETNELAEMLVHFRFILVNWSMWDLKAWLITQSAGWNTTEDDGRAAKQSKATRCAVSVQIEENDADGDHLIADASAKQSCLTWMSIAVM